MKETVTVVRQEPLKNGLIKRLSIIEGQVKGIKGMVEKDIYCNDVLVQITAVRSALSSVSKLIDPGVNNRGRRTS